MKVLIGVVTYGGHRYCLDELQASLEKQKADILFVVNNGESAYASLLKSRKLNAIEDSVKASTRIEKIINGRNAVRDYALKNKYDSVLFVDSDVILPDNALEQLQLAKKDVVSGLYLNAIEVDGKMVPAPVLYKDNGDGTASQFTYEGVYPPQLLEIGAAGFGCVLVSSKVLKDVKFRKLNSSATGGEDIAFFVDARAKKFSTFAVTTVKCVHRPFPKEDKRSVFFEWNKRVESEFYPSN